MSISEARNRCGGVNKRVNRVVVRERRVGIQELLRLIPHE